MLQKIGGYIALAIIAAVGLYGVQQLNRVGDVIGEENRKSKIERAEAKAREEAYDAEHAAAAEDNYAMDYETAPQSEPESGSEPSAATNWDSGAAEEE